MVTDDPRGGSVMDDDLTDRLRKRAEAFNDAGLKYGVADLLNEAADDRATLLDRLRTAEAERDDAVKEMHARELHHFEAEVEFDALKAKVAAAEARAAEAERERDSYALAINALAEMDDEDVPLERRSLYAFMENNSSLPAVLARVKAAIWDECRQAVFDINGGNDWLDDELGAANPYRDGANQ